MLLSTGQMTLVSMGPDGNVNHTNSQELCLKAYEFVQARFLKFDLISKKIITSGLVL